MLRKYYLSLWFYFLSLSVFCQDYSFDQLPVLFKHGENQEVIIIENEQTIIKVNENKKIPLLHNGYPGNLIDYISFYIKEKTYFVHRGCGPVLEYRNDSLVRIDNSFMHLNQFYASTFVHNDEIYFYGGYGLFTYKNILTKYDFDLKKWTLVKTKNSEIVKPFHKMYSYKDQKYLYVFGGSYHDLSMNTEFQNKQDVYRLDLEELVWKKFKTNFFDHFITSRNPFIYNSSIIINDNLFVIKDEQVYSIDLKNNYITHYSSNFKDYFYQPFIIDNEIHTIIKTGAHSTNKYKYRKYPIEVIFKDPKAFGSFYYEEKSLLAIGIPIFLILIFIGIGIGFKKRSYLIYVLNAKFPFQYQLSHQRLYFKGALLKNITNDDLKILNRIASNPNEFISLNEFNDLFANNIEKENYATIVKRREKKLDNFLKMLMNVSGYDIDKLIQVRKNENDQRIKEILILPSQIKFLA